jgi:hypothetical protein
MSAANWIEENFSPRSFGLGLAGVALVLGGLAAFSFLKGPDALKATVAAAPSQTVEILWNNKKADAVKAPVAPIIPENFVAVDIPAPVKHTDTHADDAHVQTPTPTTETAATVTPAPGVLPVNDSAAPGQPVEGLFETTQQGRLPLIRPSDKLTPFAAYRRPFDQEANRGKPIISIAVYDLGLSDSATSAAMRVLPPDVSLIMSPYMKSPEIYVTEARKKGHEVWLSLPVEVGNYPLIDPGPQTALIGAPEKDNLNKLYWTLGRATNYVGFVTPRDPAFIKAEQDMRPLMTRIYGCGLAFMDGALMPSLIPQTMAQSMSGAYGTVDVWVDATAQRENIADSLSQAENLARQQGFAAAIIHPYPLSYQMVQEWIATLPGKGIVLAPLSAQTGR